MVETQNFDLEIAELWDIAGSRLRDKNLYVNQLEELLRVNWLNEKSMILDTAGGFGFPAIDLAKRGYQICYSDGSPGMLRKAMENAEKQNAPAFIFSFQQIGYGAVPWQAYEEGMGGNAWNALLCTGNSLPYAASWGKANANLNGTREQIVETLKQFNRLLQKNGILYVDKQAEAQDRASEEVGEIELNGRKLNLTCLFNNDKINRVRNWTLKTTDIQTGAINEYPSRGYLILEDELIPLLREAGFRNISKHILKGDCYEGFVARK